MLHVIYLVFNEGYSASSGESLTRPDLSGEAIRLGRLLVELLPEPEAIGLLALMLLHESRRSARDLARRRADSARRSGSIAVESRSDRRRRRAGGARARRRAVGPYALQAAIAAVHAEAPNADGTDWRADRRPLRLAAARRPLAVVELNRAAAVAMRDGPERGLGLIDDLLARRKSRRLSPGAFGESESLPPAGNETGGSEVLSPSSRAVHAGARAPIYCATSVRAFLISWPRGSR